MIDMHREKEESVLAALLSGTLRPDLAEHIDQCETCQEILFVAQCLREKLRPAMPEFHLPKPAAIWRRAQDRARADAIAKATFPIRLAQIGAVVAAALATVWVWLSHPGFLRWMPDIGSALVRILDGNWPTILTASSLTGIIASLVFMGFSSWYVLRQD